jgi:hypothetical protein
MAPERYLTPLVLEDLQRKMVFISGPRRVGKTTLARALPGGKADHRNWDVDADRERILRHELPVGDLLILDEIHKYRRWRNHLKGLWDSRERRHRILVTGSARLECYRYSGDSLQGRYHLLRLHPFSAAELRLASQADLHALLELSGFPEPFTSGSERMARRWSREYRNRLLREDARDLESISDLGRMETLVLRLPELVGAPLSVNALREDLDVAHRTVARWLDILERLFAIFRITPISPPRTRALKKQPKHYHFDWTLVPAPAQRFENLIASHLLKWVHWNQDYDGRDFDLRYFRDKDGREVDFVVVDGRKPILMVECKLGDDEIGKGLHLLRERYPHCPAWQVHLEGSKNYLSPDGIRVAPAIELLRTLV